MESIRPIIDLGLGDRIPHESVSLIVHNRTERSIDRKVIEVE